MNINLTQFSLTEKKYSAIISTNYIFISVKIYDMRYNKWIKLIDFTN